MACESFAMRAGDPVFMLPGQGSQKPGMGEDLLTIPQVAEVFECASDVFGCDVARLCVQADAETLNEARNAQIAVSTLSLAVAQALVAHGVLPQAVLGFSLGQIGALAVSGMLSYERAFAVINERSRLMAACADQHPGAMSALLKADEDAVRALCETCSQGDVLVPANYNCPGQIVISGSFGAIERAEKTWLSQGGRCSRLATAGAFHSPLMEEAAVSFARFLQGVEFSEPRIPLICNTDAQPLSAADVRERLSAHLTQGVQFSQSVRVLAQAGATHFVETGFGGVLSGLVRRIDKSLERMSVQSLADFKDVCARYGVKGD